MLFKRYNDVSFLLSTLEISEMYDFIETMYDEMYEEKLWYVWNHMEFREGTYEDFREEILNKSKKPEQKQKEIEEEEQKGIAVSDAILGWRCFDGAV